MLENERTSRLAFQNVFVSHPDGPYVLAKIRHVLGINCTDAEKLKPDLIAFEHWLLNQIGIRHNENILDEAKALCDIANDEDLAVMERKAAKLKESENV